MKPDGFLVHSLIFILLFLHARSVDYLPNPLWQHLQFCLYMNGLWWCAMIIMMMYCGCMCANTVLYSDGLWLWAGLNADGLCVCVLWFMMMYCGFVKIIYMLVDCGCELCCMLMDCGCVLYVMAGLKIGKKNLAMFPVCNVGSASQSGHRLSAIIREKIIIEAR